MSNASSAYSELITVQLQKATSDLRRIQQLLTHDRINARVLLDFREAVDNVRHVAWGVQQWLDLHETKQDVSSVMLVLANHRVRVATQLNNDLAISLESGEVPSNLDGLPSLAKAVGRLQASLDPPR